MTKRIGKMKKLLGLVLCLVMLIGALYVPLSFTASAATSTTFLFDNWVSSSVNSTAAQNGVGYYGSGWSHSGNANPGFFAVSGPGANATGKVGSGYRIENNGSVYNLEPSTTYVIKMKLQAAVKPTTNSGVGADKNCEVKIGYNASYNKNNPSNYVNGMGVVIDTIISAPVGSDVCTFHTLSGDIQKPFGTNEWFTAEFTFTTPANLGSGDKALTLWANSYTVFRIRFDEFTITKLASDEGIAVLKDEYSNKTEVAIGKIGEEINLPDISDRANETTHVFEGWCIDEARTQSAAGLKFTAAKQTVYSKWKSPVTYIFKDTLNNKEYPVTGLAGESFTYPADPTDPSNAKWFMGWYTSEGYTEEFVDTTLGYANLTLYSLWKSEIAGLTQNFDDYKKNASDSKYVDSWEKDPNQTTKNEKDNRMYFSKLFEKVNTVTYENSPYSIKCKWDKSMTDDPNNYSDIVASSNYNSLNMYAWVGNGLDNNTQYTLTFKYYLEEANTDVRFYAATATNISIHDNNRKYGFNDDATGFRAPASDAGKGWKEGKITFTTNFTSSNHKTLYFGFTLASNQNVTIYMDDIKVEATVQPYEAAVNIVTNNNTPNEVIKGERGKAVNLPTLTHPDGAQLLGYFLDEALTVPAENLVFARKPITVYAKWGVAPITFNNYTFSREPVIFGRLMSIDESGIGITNDNALRFKFAGDMVYKYRCSVCGHSKQYNTQAELDSHIKSDHGGKAETKKILFNERTSDKDHCFPIANNVKDDAVYKITFSYKVLGANANITVNTVTCKKDSIWESKCLTTYPTATAYIPGKKGEWKTASIALKTDLKSDTTQGVGDTLALYLTLDTSATTTKVDLLIDNVIIESAEGDAILFDSTQGQSAIVSGKAGDPFTAPTFTGNSAFLGWYLDTAYETPFTATTMPAGQTIVFGKWAPGPMTFEKYDFPRDPFIFGRLMSVDDSGLGIDDDYALRFNFAGNMIYKYRCSICGDSKKYNTQAELDAHNKSEHGGKAKTEIVLFKTRSTDKDHCFPIAKNVSDKSLYKITFKYKYLKADTTVAVTAATCMPNSIWDTDNTTKYDLSKTKLPNKGGWQTATMYVNTDIKGKGDTLALFITFGASEKTKIDLLFDNVIVEKIEAPYVFFDGRNGKDPIIVKGKAGEKIKKPANPTRFDGNFKGWFLDTECTKPFKTTTFAADTAIAVYAGYNRKDTILYEFENYDIDYYLDIDKAKLQLVLAHHVKAAKAVSGSHVIEIDRTTELTHESFFVIAEGEEVFKLDPTKQYLVEFKYRVTSKLPSSMTLYFDSAGETNFYDGKAQISGICKVKSSTTPGVWYSSTLLVDGTKAQKDKNWLYLAATGDDGKLQIDNVKISVVKPGTCGVVIQTDGCSQIPSVIYGKKDESFLSKLPMNPTMPGKYFAGYYVMDANGGLTKLGEDGDKFKDGFVLLQALFLNYSEIQTFDAGYYEYNAQYPACGIIDFDYEVYDSLKEGNSKDNVTSGRYSLHRKGTSKYFESAVVLNATNQISPFNRYTVTMKVKLGKHLHTDGAIKIYSNRSYQYAWAKTGEYHPVVAIKDLKEGEWVTVSYTFDSAEPFISIQTPGYVELFIDDIQFKLETDPTVLASTPPAYTEYVVAERDANGNLLGFIREDVDISTIIDSKLKSNKTTAIIVTIIIIVAAVLVAAAATLAVIFIIKKKKKAKGQIKV